MHHSAMLKQQRIQSGKTNVKIMHYTIRI